jgi:putative NADH-flavin reductase
VAVHLTIFGATGGTGQRLTEQALAAGHRVTAAARRPQALTRRHERLRVVRADVLDPASLPPAVAGADAVISALGIGYRRHATTVYSAGTRNVIAAMAGAGVRRLVCVSTSGLTVPADGPLLHRLVLRHVLHRLLRKPYADMSLMEELVRASDADWTIVRAARLTNGPPDRPLPHGHRHPPARRLVGVAARPGQLPAGGSRRPGPRPHHRRHRLLTGAPPGAVRNDLGGEWGKSRRTWQGHQPHRTR